MRVKQFVKFLNRALAFIAKIYLLYIAYRLNITSSNNFLQGYFLPFWCHSTHESLVDTLR